MKKITLIQLPLLLSKSLNNSVKKDIEKNYRGKIQINGKLLQSKKEELLKLLNKLENQKDISNAFDKVFQASNEEQSVSFADPHHIEQQFDSLEKINLSTLLKKLSKNSHDIKDIELAIANLEQQISDDKKEYESDFTLAIKMTEDIIRQTIKCETLSEEILTLKAEHKELKKELGKLTMKEHKNDLANAKVKTLKSIVAVSKIIKKKIKTDKRANLETSINKKFQLLRKKGYEADKIILDENFHINLYDNEGNAMDILSSSSGQKQIIATALIWGISEYIAEDIPMIIDTPLGRLDERNQSLILNKFYPEVSKQVIILPTPSELKHEGFKSLIKHISQTFLLKNAGSATSVKEINIKDVISPTKQTTMEFN